MSDQCCPDHGNTLVSTWLLVEYRRYEHLECCIKDCRYEVWA
jgi:hypothetical protein